MSSSDLMDKRERGMVRQRYLAGQSHGSMAHSRKHTDMMGLKHYNGGQGRQSTERQR